MIRTLLWIIAATVMPTSGFAQNTLIYQWDNSIGGYGSDFISRLIATDDGGFLIGGTSSSSTGLDVTSDCFDTDWLSPAEDVWLAKCDANGAVEWDARFGTTEAEWFGDIQQTDDGGYILCFSAPDLMDGNLTVPGYGLHDIYVMKLSSNGSVDWQRRLGGDQMEYTGGIMQTADGGYLITGGTASSNSGTINEAVQGPVDMYVARLDMNGDLVWSELIGGPDTDYARSAVSTPGGYFIAGGSLSGVGGDKTIPNHQSGETDFWVVKVDPNGLVLQQRIVGSLESDNLGSAIGYPDGGLLLSTTVWAGIGGDKTENTWGATDGWVIRLDADLNILWDRSVGGDLHEDDFGWLSVTSTGDILASGTSYSTINTGWKGEDNVGPENTWVVLMDPSGNKLWDKTVHTGYAHSETGLVVQLLDGCFVIADNGDALVGNEKTDQSMGFDYWAIKFCEEVMQPTSAFDIELFPGCATVLMDLVNQSTGATSWTWNVEGTVLSDPHAQFQTDVLFSQEGQFEVQLIACNGGLCDTAEQVVDISFQGTLEVDIGENLVLCDDDEVILDTEYPTAQHIWYHDGMLMPQASSSVAVVEEPGTYVAMVTDSNGCTGSDSVVVITVDEAITLGADQIACEGSTVQLQSSVITGAFQWYYNGSPIGGNSDGLSVNQSGTYTVDHTYDCGMNSDAVVVTFIQSPEPVVLPDQLELCEGASVLATVIHEVDTVLWSTGEIGDTLVITVPGTYHAMRMNSCGQVSDSVVVIAGSSPIDLGADLGLCPGSSARIRSNVLSGDLHWFIDGISVGSGSETLTVTGPGMVVVQHSSACGVRSDTVVVSVILPPTPIGIPEHAELCEGDNLIIGAEPSADPIVWSTGSWGDTLTITTTGVYLAIRANACGQIMEQLIVEPCPVPLHLLRCEVFLPNAFTPNEDGINDVFRPVFDPTCSAVRILRIYDRWGELLYEAKGNSSEWGGADLANLPNGVYVYQCEVDYQIGPPGTIRGHVSLVR